MDTTSLLNLHQRQAVVRQRTFQQSFGFIRRDPIRFEGSRPRQFDPVWTQLTNRQDGQAVAKGGVGQQGVPHAADQARQAEGVARSGVGYRFAPKDVTVPVLVQALRNALPDDSPIRTNARALQAEFASLGGVSVAADLLEGLAQENVKREA